MLQDPAFSRTRRTAELLRYLVEKCLAGGEEHLKEYVLGTEVFQKGEDFDPRIDSTVRVGVNQLRAKLREYYTNSGSEDQIRIELPHGSYVPQFRFATEVDPKPELEVVQFSSRAEAGNRGRKLWAVWGLVGAFVAAGAVYWALRPEKSFAPQIVSPQRLQTARGVHAFPSLGADGRTMLFSTDQDGASALNLWRRDLATGTMQKLTDSPNDETEVSMSPDGKYYAFRSTAEGGGIYLQESSSAAPELVGEHGLAPRFSPDGKRLLFWVADPFTGHGKVYAKEVGSNAEPDQKLRGFADAHDAIWTRDSQHMLFCGTRRSGEPDQEHDVWVASPDGDFSVKTGAFDILREQNIALHSITLRSTPFTLAKGGILIEVWSGGSADLWFLALHPASYKARGPAVRVHPGAHASIAGETIVFAMPDSNVDIWSFPLDHRRRKSEGPAKRLTSDGADDIGSRAAVEDGPILFMSNRSRAVASRMPILSTRWSAYARMADGTEQEITKDLSPSRGLLMDERRGEAYYRVLEGPPPSKQAIYKTPIQGGVRTKVCSDCGTLTDLIPGTGQLLYETPTERNRLALHDPATQRSKELLRHNDAAVRAGRLSPNGKWIAFQLDLGKGTRRLYVAPFRGMETIPFPEWIAGAPAEWVVEDPNWAPDGRAIYFLTHSTDGKPAVYSVLFDPETGAVDEKPVEALRFPRLGFSILRPTGMKSMWSGLSVTKDSLVLSVRTLESTLWTGTLR